MDVDEVDPGVQPPEEEASHNALELGDSTENVSQIRTSARNHKRRPPAKTFEKKGQKQPSMASASNTTLRSEPYNYEPLEVVLKPKTFHANEGSKYIALEIEKRIVIPPKEGEFQVGDLIWAKMGSYPWWPAMVSIDPETGGYSKCM